MTRPLGVIEAEIVRVRDGAAFLGRLTQDELMVAHLVADVGGCRLLYRGDLIYVLSPARVATLSDLERERQTAVAMAAHDSYHSDPKRAA
jgi:hypothetical protein